MSEVKVEPVTTSGQRKQFLRLPWELYKGDPNWVPPLRANQKELVGYASHPFYDVNQIQTFLATRDGKPCGRIAAILNQVHVDRHKENVGFFGFFESVDDSEVAGRLFDAARQWLADKGMETIRGPVNPSMNYECGLLVEGFDTPPTFMMTYNHPYYEKLLLEQGFENAQNLYAFDGHIDMLETLDQKLTFVVEEATRRFNLDLRKLDRSRFHEEVRMFLRIYNDSLGGTWGFTPLSEGEIAHMSKSLQHLIVPEMTSVAEVDGKPVGAVFGLLDFNPRIKAIDGKLFPFGFMRLLMNKRKIKRVRLISTNVVPEYQRWGVGLVLMSRLVPESLKWGIKEAEFSWVLESNELSLKTLKRGGAILKKTYRLYDAPLESNPPTSPED